MLLNILLSIFFIAIFPHAKADCIELIEEIKFLEHRAILKEAGYSNPQSEQIIKLLHQYEINPSEISLLTNAKQFDLSAIEQALLNRMVNKYPYPKDWTEFIDPDVFPFKPQGVDVRKVISIAEVGDEKLLSYSGFNNKNILRDIKKIFGGGNKIEIHDARGNPISRGTLDSNLGKKIKIVDTSKNPGVVKGEFTLGIKKSKYKEGSLPQLETGKNQQLQLIRSEELLRQQLETLPRHADAEIRQLEYLNDVFRRTPPDKRPKRIMLNTTKAPCESCYRAIKTFQKRYGIEIDMRAKEPYLP